jgi:hypothetical protein
VNVEFLGCSERQPDDIATKFIDGFTVMSIRPCGILFPTAKTESPIVQDGETALDPPGAALLGS